jgi:O-antigen/teichoic acid export membrane protein/O-antigen ligase
MPTPRLVSRVTRARHAMAGSDENLLGRSLTLNVGGRVLSLVTGFTSSVLLARLLGPADRGLLALMLSTSTVALAVTAIGQPLAVTYFASRKDADSPAIIGNVFLQAGVLSIVLLPLVALLKSPIADALGEGHGGTTWVLAAALVPITFLDWTTSNQLLGMLRFGFYNGLKFVAGIGYTIAIVLLLAVAHLGVSGGLIATALASVITVLGCVRPILGRARPKVDRTLMARMLKYGSRVQVGVIFQMVNYRLDVIIMQFFRPLSQVGYYVAAQTVAEFVITIATAFQSSLLPLVSHFEGDERQDRVTANSLRHHGILAGAAVLANAVVGTAIIYFAYGSKFHPAVLPMLVLLPGVWFLGMGLVIQSDLGGRGRPGLSSKLAALAAGVTVVLDFALIPPLGVMGGAIASVCAYTTFGIASLIALHRVSSIPIRELVVPKRADFRLYWAFARRAARWVSGSRGGRPSVSGNGRTMPPPAVRASRIPPAVRQAFTRSDVGPRSLGPPSASLIERHGDQILYAGGLILLLAMLPLISNPLYCFGLVAILICGLVAWRSPAVPLGLCGLPPLVDFLVGSDPLPSGGFTLLFSAWIILAVVFALVRGRLSLAPWKVVLSVAGLASLALLGLMLIRLGVSPDSSYGSVKVQLYAADVLIIFIGAVFVATDVRHLHLFLMALLVVDATGALFFMYDLLAGTAQTVVGGRYSLGAAEYPIDMGRASADGLLLAIYAVLTATKRVPRTLAVIAIPILAVALAAAGSRGPVVAFAFGLLALLGLTATNPRARSRLTLVAAMFLVAIVVVPLVVPSSALARALSTIIGSASGLSSNGRSDLWAVALGSFSHHFWLGLGTGGFASLNTGLAYPHNLLLEMATELGIVGLVLVLMVLGSFIRALGRCHRLAVGTDRTTIALVISLFLTALVNANFSDPIQGNGSVWLWGGVAIGMSARLSRRRDSRTLVPDG